MDDATTRLLGLDGPAIAAVDDGVDGPVVHLVTADEQSRRCPERGTVARRSKGRRTTRPRDLPVGGRRPHLVWRKRRWRCDEASCPRRWTRLTSVETKLAHYIEAQQPVNVNVNVPPTQPGGTP